MEYKLFTRQRCSGKRYAMAGVVAAQLLAGKTVLSISTDPDGTRKAIEDRLKLWGDSEPETALCGLAECQR
jgi:hypothetical protein